MQDDESERLFREMEQLFPDPEITVSKLVEAWTAGGDCFGIWFDAYTKEPEIAWEAILEVLNSEMSDKRRAALAAGPMEELLVLHGPAFIDRVEEEAKRNPRLNYLLGGVWRQEMPEEIWSRVEKVRKETW
jgi:hypothetical protein